MGHKNKQIFSRLYIYFRWRNLNGHALYPQPFDKVWRVNFYALSPSSSIWQMYGDALCCFLLKNIVHSPLACFCFSLHSAEWKFIKFVKASWILLYWPKGALSMHFPPVGFNMTDAWWWTVWCFIKNISQTFSMCMFFIALGWVKVHRTCYSIIPAGRDVLIKQLDHQRSCHFKPMPCVFVVDM